MWKDRDGSLGLTLVTAVFAGVAGVAGSYAATGYTPSFVAAPIASFLTRTAPDAVLRFAIVTLTGVGRRLGIEHLGQRANLALALALGTALFASLVLIALSAGRRVDRPLARAGLAGILVWAATVVLTGAPVDAVGAGVASAAVAAVPMVVPAADGPPGASAGGRRRAVSSLASALGVVVVGYAFGWRSRGRTDPSSAPSMGGADRGTVESPAVERLLAEAESKSLDVEGLEGLVSGRDFYEVDIQSVNPDVDSADWTLSVTGAVESELAYDYEGILSMEPDHRHVTLRCVSDPLNGKKMDNAVWTGVPFEELIADANPEGEFVMLRSVDGYYQEFPIEALRTGLLAYRMDGRVLPRRHGYPARALIPGHWGEINVKWLTEIEVLDRPAKGFWEKRGWHGTGPVNTVAKLHATARHADGRITVGGHANAGTRGIQRVEVSTDGGESWRDARLSDPLTEADDVWRQWAYTYRPPSGRHRVIVRAIDGTGTRQTRERQSPYPSGATGWVTKAVEP